MIFIDEKITKKRIIDELNFCFGFLVWNKNEEINVWHRWLMSRENSSFE